MKYFIYLASGFIFSWGLLLSGMVDPMKIKNFLSVGTSAWSAALIFVLLAASSIYLMFFMFLRLRGRTLNGAPFSHPKPRPTDKKLALGSVIFGLGWGIAGLCPGPAIVHLAFPSVETLVFIVSMITGFEIQKRFV